MMIMICLKGFVEGGLASIVAGCSTHPLDLIKVRMQLEGIAAAASCSNTVNPNPRSCTPLSLGIRLVQTEGIRGLYTGVSATLLRQVLYSATRMAVYETLKKRWLNCGGSNEEMEESGVGACVKTVAAGLIAGAVGAAVGNPADVAMIRMQADSRLPLHLRSNYKGVVDVMARLVREEGVSSLWHGSSLTIQRAMVVTAAQLATYDQAMAFLLLSTSQLRSPPPPPQQQHRDGLMLRVVAACTAGLVAAVASNPIDVVKTRIMSASSAAAAAAYNSPLDCAMKAVRLEGPAALYKGFWPTLVRQGPFTVIFFLTLEHIRTLWKLE